MKKAIFFLLVILIFASATLAQENLGARPVGMGGAFVGLADDVNAIFENPAGIGYLQGEHASVSTKIEPNKEYTLIGGVEKTPYGSLGIGYIGSASPGDDLFTKVINQTLVFSYARELNEFMVVPKSMGKLSLGTNLKFSNSRLIHTNGLSQDYNSGVNVDFAFVYKLNDALSWGLNLINNSSQVATGLSGKFLDKSLTWSVAGESRGCEWKPVEALALRVGKDGDYNTAGLGININGFSIDYAYMEKEVPVHYFAVSVASSITKPETELKRSDLSFSLLSKKVVE